MRFTVAFIALAGLCSCRPRVVTESPSLAPRVPDLEARERSDPAGREQVRHALLLPSGELVVAGRRMQQSSWDSVPVAWVAKFDRDGRRIWSSAHPTSKASAAERVAVDDEGRVFAVGRSADALWVRAYDPRGAVRWEQSFGAPGETLVGLGASRDGADGVWVLLGREQIDAWHVAIDGVAEDGARVLEYPDVYTLDTGPAWALPDGAFYFPSLDLVSIPGEGTQTWDLDDERDDDVMAAADEQQVVLASAVEYATMWRSEDDAVTLTQDGRSVRWTIGERDAEPEPQWGFPWDVDAEHALAWFEGVDAGGLADALRGESRASVVEVLLADGLESACEPTMIATSCSEYEVAETGEWMDTDCQRAVLLGTLLEDAPADHIRAWSDELAGIIESLPSDHPLGESLEASLDNHRVPEVALAFGWNDAYRDRALKWLEENNQRDALRALEAELVEAGESCEFVADIRASLTRLGAPSTPFRLAEYADACEQLYDLCANGEGIESMIPAKGYHLLETCADDFSEDDNGVESCEEVDARSVDDLSELLSEEMVGRCAQDVIQWGEFDPEGNCGVLVANDEHTVEFESAGPGRWTIAEHFVSWTVEAP